MAEDEETKVNPVHRQLVDHGVEPEEGAQQKVQGKEGGQGQRMNQPAKGGGICLNLREGIALRFTSDVFGGLSLC